LQVIARDVPEIGFSYIESVVANDPSLVHDPTQEYGEASGSGRSR
jgi:hypothetical protein